MLQCRFANNLTGLKSATSVNGYTQIVIGLEFEKIEVKEKIHKNKIKEDKIILFYDRLNQ